MDELKTDPLLDETLKLPPIYIIPIQQSIGYISCLLRQETTQKIIRKEIVKISPRISEQVYVLENGEKVLITKRKKILRPVGINGVISKQPGETIKWMSHELLDSFESDVKSKGLQNIVREIENTWDRGFSYVQEKKDAKGEIIFKGLRPPQIGGLHAIGAHWSLYDSVATIVMPTGTGKTETMLATAIAYKPGKILIIVPSNILRIQTVKKFLTLGLLYELGATSKTIRTPIVGTITKRPVTAADLEIFDRCNILISTMSALSSETSMMLAPEIAKKVDALIVDEAHHVAAKTWLTFRERLKDKKILQFTATPYRRDGKLVDGRVIFNYPLHNAQLDGYFKPITFEPVYEVDDIKGDYEIAARAIKKLREDISNHYDHLVMARCENIERAKGIHKIYAEIGAEFNPVIIHSEGIDVNASLEKIKRRASRIIVCVDMLGEGFDLPQLKIAGLHDTHKSLAVLLQFTGRFTRVAGSNIGEATVIGNTANQNVSIALERLYSEDADWNQLLSEFSSQAAQSHAALVDFLNTSEKLVEEDEDELEISHQLLHPSMGTLIYNCDKFIPENFFKAIPKNVVVQRVWIHRKSNTLYFVTRSEPTVDWTRSQELKDRIWTLFVLHYNDEQKLLYLSSNDKSSVFESLAKAVGSKDLIFGDTIFRSLGKISRLIFQNVGVRKHGRRNLSFAMYTGADVAQALSITETTSSVKSNLSGTGWEDGMPVTIGCSFKGRIWSRDAGSIPELIIFCEHVGSKVIDDSINTKDIIANVLIPEEVTNIPDLTVINIDWPAEILRQIEDRVIFKKEEIEETNLTMIDIKFIQNLAGNNQIEFELTSDEVHWGKFILSVDAAYGFKVEQADKPIVTLTIGKLDLSLAEYLTSYPPIIRFVDLSELDGNLLIKPQHVEQIDLPETQLISFDWTGIDITKESIWKKGVERHDSIQWRIAQEYIKKGFEIVFDDDNAGEAADLICLNEEADYIQLVLIHCKFSGSVDPGERIKDVVEVCSQAIRSAKWKWKFQDLCKHIVTREKRLSSAIRRTRFIKGSPYELNKFSRLSKLKKVLAEIIIVQPGISATSITSNQKIILGAAFGYLKETVDVELQILCSA